MSSSKLSSCFFVITKKHDDNFDEDIYEDVSFVPMLPGKSEDGIDIWKKN